MAQAPPACPPRIQRMRSPGSDLLLSESNACRSRIRMLSSCIEGHAHADRGLVVMIRRTEGHSVFNKTNTSGHKTTKNQV